MYGINSVDYTLNTKFLNDFALNHYIFLNQYFLQYHFGTVFKMHKLRPIPHRINPIWSTQINQDLEKFIQNINLLENPQLLQEMNQFHCTQSSISQKQLNRKFFEENFLSNQLNDHQHHLMSEFMHTASRFHLQYLLKFSTLFLAYSLAQKTVHMVDLSIPHYYWITACLYLSIKYQQVRSLKIRQFEQLNLDKIIHFIKQPIEKDRYFIYEIQILKQIDQNLNFVSFHTLICYFLPPISKEQRYPVFYILETALFNRKALQRYSLREVVMSIIFMFFPDKNLSRKESKPYGVEYSILKKCSQKIQQIKNSNQSNKTFIYKKYRVYGINSQQLIFHGPKTPNPLCKNVQIVKTKKIKRVKIVQIKKNK